MKTRKQLIADRLKEIRKEIKIKSFEMRELDEARQKLSDEISELRDEEKEYKKPID